MVEMYLRDLGYPNGVLEAAAVLGALDAGPPMSPVDF